MPEQTLVVLVDFVVEHHFLMSVVVIDRLFETVEDLLQNGLVEHHALTGHHTHHVASCQQLTALEDDAIGASVECIDPKALVEYLACEDEHMDVRVFLAQCRADVNSHGGGTAQSEVEQNQVWQFLTEQGPQFVLCHCRSDDFRLGDVVAEDLFGAFQFQFGVFYNDYFEFIHILYFFTFICFVEYSRV